MLRIVSLAVLGVYWATIFIGTHMPRGMGSLNAVDDKFLHFGAYAGLAFLIAAALATRGWRRGALLVPLMVAAIYGCLDELSQLAVPGRQAELADWVADVLGAGLGILVFGALSLLLGRLFAQSPALEQEVVTETAA